MAWHAAAGLTLGMGFWYLWWRWTYTLNPEAPVFSVLVVLAETLIYIGSALFFYDVWDEGDTPARPAPSSRAEAHLDEDGTPSDGPICVDVFITTIDETAVVLRETMAEARGLRTPPNVRTRVHLLDDGDRAWAQELARQCGANYIRRDGNEGFKAGNLKNALWQTDGDFIVVCDADTRLFPGFLERTLGYFRNPRVAWVQTPHWFYDIPGGADDPARHRPGRSNRRLVQRILGRDPFGSDPEIFFDIIQRRRNRNGASFCCGAGSIHRRDALFEAALLELGTQATGPARDGARHRVLQPFHFHVSEDLFTSMVLHASSRRWTSVYHPRVESRMLSPWTLRAWQTQRLKYAGGSFDILLRRGLLFRKGMPLRIRLHYGATFWAYLSSIWLLGLLLAPAISLFSGIAPVQTTAWEFFAHLLPVLFANELAMVLAGKGKSFNEGRILAIATIPLNLRALWMVLRGKRPRFPPTPKIPLVGSEVLNVLPHLGLLSFLMAALVWSQVAPTLGFRTADPAMIVVNVFWVIWNALALVRMVLAAWWRPDPGVFHPQNGDVTPSDPGPRPLLPVQLKGTAPA